MGRGTIEVRAGYWMSGIPVSEIDSTLFTHLIFAQAYVNTSSFEVLIRPSDEEDLKEFSNKVKEKNPSIKTLLTIWGKDGDTYSSMVNNYSSRSSFIQSSLNLAREHGFDGLDLYWDYPRNKTEMEGMAILLKEWRQSKDDTDPQLILTATVPYSPYWPFNESIYPIESMAANLNWVHLKTYFYIDRSLDVTAAHSALYDPSSIYSTDYGIKHWIHRGLMPNKMVLGLAFYGYAWNLADPKNNAIGAPATGPAQTQHGLGMMTYKEIKDQVASCRGNILYNDTYKICYWSCGSTWIGFDDVETIKIKVSYAKEKNLHGYVAWQVSADDKWLLSRAAKGEDNKAKQEYHRPRLRNILLAIAAASVLLLSGLLVYILKRRMFKLKANEEAAKHLNANAPYVQVFSFFDIEKATNRFSIENKIGAGGFGVVYKGILPKGETIAVKKRSKGSKQGFEELKNEITLASKLQHVNLVRLLGFCTDKEEQMLVYEYMPNKSLDFYLFNPERQHLLDWGQRVCIIEGVMQGLLYLQEYSRLTVIHRDLKASNILLDHEMKPRIADFGMARPFKKDVQESTNGSGFVGTYGYIPPEYVKKGLWSVKSDVYSFGVLLLQIISGKRISGEYGESDLNLLDYAYKLWKEGKGMEFMEASLDDTCSECKLTRCLQVALLCVQNNAEDRPFMLQVSTMLRTEANNNIAAPKQPAYSQLENAGGETIIFVQRSEICSQNETTMSPVLAR